MNRFFLLTVCVVLYASSLAQVQALATEPAPRVNHALDYQLGGEGQRVDGNRQRSSRPNRPQAIVTGAYEANPKKAVASFQAKAVEGCKCGEDCECPDEMVCKNGDCKKNYVVFFTAPWCKPCRIMYPRIEKLRKEGYIVYAFDDQKFPNAISKFEVENFPTLVVMENGQEIKRFVGVTDPDTIKEVAKTKDEQTDKTNTDYNFL